MKSKIIILILIAFSIHKTDAQNARNIDVRVRILDPVNGSVFYSPTNLTVKYSVFNKGVDTIQPYDTLIVRGFSNVTYKAQFVKVNQLVVPNDSVVKDYIMPIDFPNDFDGFQILLSATVYSWGPDKISDETLDMQKDNRSQITLKHRRSSSISNIHHSDLFNVFPNPAHSVLCINRLKLTEGPVKVTITDVQGKLTKQIEVDGNVENMEIQIEELATGTYLLSIDGKQVFETFKFIKL